MSKITTRLQQAEEVIEQGLISYKEAGKALMDIRDEGLYKQHYATFEEYCSKRWNFGKSRAYQLIDASKVAINLSTIVDVPNEGQARELTKLDSPELQKAAYGVAETIAEQSKAGKVTAKDVKNAVEIVHKVIQDNPSIKPEDIAAKAVEHGVTTGIKPNEEPNTQPEVTEKDLHIDALNTEIESVYEENERLRNRIAANAMPKEDREEQFKRLNELLDENKKLKAMNAALIKSRDNVMTENVSLKKQCQIYMRKLKKYETK